MRRRRVLAHQKPGKDAKRVIARRAEPSKVPTDLMPASATAAVDEGFPLGIVSGFGWPETTIHQPATTGGELAPPRINGLMRRAKNHD